MRRLAVLDLYSGCGGLSLGFEMTGAFEVVAGIDHFDWAVKSFYANHPNACVEFASPIDLSVFTGSDIVERLGRRPDVIIGGPPCQGFSKAGKRTGVDERNQQIWHYQRIVEQIRPEAFILENVDGLLTTGQKQRGELRAQLEAGFHRLGYTTQAQVLDAVDYRVPQRRKRFILVGLQDNRKRFRFPEPSAGNEGTLFSPATPHSTVGDALADLPSPVAADPQPYRRVARTWLQELMREGSDAIYNHTPSKHSPEMVERLKAQAVGTRLYPNWNHSWYRLDPSRPSPAVKENHRAPFVHYEEPRVATPRECARLQTFPDRFKILGTKTAQLIQVGNAVPALLAASVATALADVLGASALVERPDGIPAPAAKIAAGE